MSVNLNKYKESLLAAWKDVLDDKTPTNWALFSYEGQSNDLKFISKGSDGIEELTEDLNSGKIMYAFLRVIDPKTSLPKSVLINWQGEGAPNNRKGTCANHIRDVSNLFKGAHVTVNARTEEEVDPAIIMEKVAKSSASVYKFNERVDHVNDSGPVGTTYKRVIPKQEINAVERDKFWEQQEVEEKQRQLSERLRMETERKKTESERTKRDSEETARREASIKESSRHINEMRQAEKESLERSQGQMDRAPVEDIEKEELERRNRSDVLRRQRSEEAQSLIAKRTVDARAVFEKNTAAGQLNQRRSSGQPKTMQGSHIATKKHAQNSQHRRNTYRSAILESIVKKNDEPVKNDQVTRVTEQKPIESGRQSNGAIPKNSTNGATREPSVEDDWEDEVRHEIPVTTAPAQFQDEAVAPTQSEELSARALYDYKAADETEITFDPGDVITHIDQIDEGWWQGLSPDGTFGLFPANYVELIN